MNSFWIFAPGVGLIMLIMLEFLFAIAILLWKRWGGAQPQIKAAKESPCKSCRFFVNNPHLYCAVQPSLVLRRESQQCLDYLSD